MSRVTKPRSNSGRRLTVLVATMVLLSCAKHSPVLDVSLDASKEFKITVRNESEDFLDVDDRLLGLGIDSSVKVEVAHPNGAIIPFCRHIDYVGSPKSLPVVPHGKLVISIPLSAITLTHCLRVNESYIFRAVRTSDGELVSRTDWVPFRAVSPLTDATGQ